MVVGTLLSELISGNALAKAPAQSDASSGCLCRSRAALVLEPTHIVCGDQRHAGLLRGPDGNFGICPTLFRGCQVAIGRHVNGQDRHSYPGFAGATCALLVAVKATGAIVPTHVVIQALAEN